MRTRERVGIAVRHEDTGEILTDGFDLPPRTQRWAAWPLVRGVLAIHMALSVGKRALTASEELRWSVVAGADEEEEEEEEASLGFGARVLIVLSAFVGVGIQVAAFRIAPIVIAKEIGLTGAAFIVTDALLRLSLLLLTLWVLSRFRPFRRILGYHGAEHKAIAAFEAGRPLTVEAAAPFSRFHPRCGTSFLVVSALVSIAVYGAVLAVTGIFTYPALIATRIIGAPIVTAISFELQRRAAMRARGRLSFLSAPGLLAQRLTTAEPDAEELQVACAALSVALDPVADMAKEADEPAREAATIPQPSPAS